MSKSRPRRRPGHGEIVQPLSKQDRIGELLGIQAETFPPKELTAEEIGRWEKDLEQYPLEAIEFAFDEHRRLAMFFPVPGQIIDLCETFTPRVDEGDRKCSRECQSRHGKGYGWIEVMKIWKLHEKVRSDLGRPLTEDEFDLLLNAVDQQTGHAPEWRKTA